MTTTPTTSTTKKTFCTICSAFCGFDARVEDGRVVDLVPDQSHPMSRGFSCTKGRQLHHLLTADDRITHPLSRVDGELVTGDREAALDDIAARLDAIRAEHGPEAIAVYCGNGTTFKTSLPPAAHSWLHGLGSHQFYSSLTIDQPAKIISAGRVGVWAGGTHDFESADVAMLIGNNVVVSGLHVPGGAPGWRPRAIQDARQRGLRLIVVDPRRTETANLADLHLQIRPGEDATLLAGMVKLILDSDRHDAAFCEEFVEGLDELRTAIAPFTLDVVARRTGLAAADIEAATDLFVNARRGTASSATGPDMGPHGNVTEHLIATLNIVCGRFNRAGEVNENVGMLVADLPSVAAVVPRDFLPKTLNPDANTRRSRIHGAHQVFREMPTGTLADEILTPGEGQVRALVVIGGNPLASWPDQDKTRRALESLDLLVCIEVRHTDTVALADHVLPAAYGLERPELTGFSDYLYNRPFVQFADAVVEAPGEAQEEWVYLAGLARRLGTTMEVGGTRLDLDDLPSPRELVALLYPEGTTRVPIAEIMELEGGTVFEQFEGAEVLAKFEGMDDRFQLFPEGVADEVATLLDTDPGEEGRYGVDGAFTHLLTCRRNRYVYNSMCHELPRTANANPAHLHPTDLAALGIESGQVMRLVSAHGAIEVQVAADETLRPGVVSLSHAFGSVAAGERTPEFGTVSRLVSTDDTLDRITRMPRLSALPVRLEPVG